MKIKKLLSLIIGSCMLVSSFNFMKFDNNNIVIAAEVNTSAYDSAFIGKGTAENPYQIWTKTDFLNFKKIVTTVKGSAGLYFVQMADIDLENEPYVSSYFRFSGIYNGNNKRIYNLNVTDNEKFSGLFGILHNGGRISNLVVEGNVNNKSGGSTGGIAGEIQWNSKISNCAFIGDVKSSEWGWFETGGIVGCLWQGGIVENCYHYGNVSARNHAGGIVGGIGLETINGDKEFYNIYVLNCYHAGGKVTTKSGSGGGIVGKITIVKEGYTVTLTNNYYLDTSAPKAVQIGSASSDDSKRLSLKELQNAADSLGKAYTHNWDKNSINGLPIFSSQVFDIDITYSNTKNDLEYPIYNAEEYASQLEKWFEDSDYEYILNEYLKTHTYDDLLHLKINVPVGEDDETAFLIDTPTEVKDIMSYLFFASRANPYINYTIKNVTDQINDNKNQDAYKYFLKRTQNFSSQYYYFMKSLNGEDAMMSDLTKLLLAKTAMTLVDTLKVTYKSGEIDYIVIHPDAETYDTFIETHEKDIVNVIPLKDYRYITDLYAASLDQSPEYYDDLYYYIMSGGDTSYLNSFHQDTLKGYSAAIKDTKALFKIKAGDFNKKDAIDLGFDNLSYFADQYDWNSSSTIKEGKKAWENASDAYDLLSAVLDCSLVGALTASYKISNTYIDEVKKVYVNAQDVEDGWYALTYFYLSQNNKQLLKSLIDSESGSAEFDYNRWATCGFPVHHDDPIEENLSRYYEKNSYVAHTYTPDDKYRMYLMKTCNDMNVIQKIDIENNKKALLDYIIASINYENGLVGVPFYVSVSSNDTTLGSVSESKAYMANSSASIEATPFENVTFAGWYDTNTGDIISTSRELTFRVHDNMNLQAKFVAGQFTVAEKPTIQEQPVGAIYYVGETPNGINISATTTDDGSLRIDWFCSSQNTNQGGDFVSSGKSVIPSTDETGTFYYYAVITNTITSKVGLEEEENSVSVRSNPVRIDVKSPFLDKIEANFPEKREYDLNEQIDTTGMIVTAHYSNGDTKEITDYVINYDFSTIGSHVVDVIYDGKITSFEVNVVCQVLPGDVNYDGQVTVSDAVMLQKWLLCASDSITCWENADLCKDDIIDIYDLAFLRKVLLDSKQ